MDQSQTPKHAEQVKPTLDPLPNSGPSAPVVDTAPPPPLTPAAWVMSNGPWLLIFALILGFIWYKLGLDGVWVVSKVGLGLGFLIFIHELGHFLAAKWCDVHVQAFSIGFGPALPGCSFQRGETTYKISVLPLGGYVNMVGEGTETDEDENYPRSFKNKTVGQRMLIISAGVIMNVLLGCILFVIVYYHGVEQAPAIVGRVDPASPLWEKGIPTGSLITELDGIQNPVFKNLRIKVALSSAGEKIPFTFLMYGPDGQPLDEKKSLDLLPRRLKNDDNPIIGVSPPEQLRLEARPKKDTGILPVVRGSAASRARPVPVEPNEVIVAATDPDKPERMKPIAHDLKAGTFDYLDFSKCLRADQKLVVHVLPMGADEKAEPAEREVPLAGFQFDDTIVGCTKERKNPGERYNPFDVSELPRDPRDAKGKQRDPFVFHNRLRQLAGLPMVIQVRRADPNHVSRREVSLSGEVVNLFVPPAFHVTFGLRMKMGKVAGLRMESPAARAGVQKGDELIKVVMTDERDKPLHTWAELDPERLPDAMAKEATHTPGKKKVILTVRRESNHQAENHTLKAVEWEDRWDDDREVPLSLSSPLAIPQLGIAYWVLSQIVEVKKDSPAATARLVKDDTSMPLRKEDTIKEMCYKKLSQFQQEPVWSNWYELESKRDARYDCWAQVFRAAQTSDFKEIQVRVNRPGEEIKEAIALTAREDPSWPLVSRGLKLQSDFVLQKADNFSEALVMGGRETRDMIATMYLQLRSLLTGRISSKGVGGPFAMVTQGFFFAQLGNYELMLFLAMISINLAVVNFLPIPILDGGHMVFLIYEKLRGRPPAEKVRAIGTYIGLATIGLLMIFVFYQDFQNYLRKMLGI